MALSIDRRQALAQEDVSASVELRLQRQHLLQVRVVGEGHELLEDVPRNHPCLFPEDGEALRLAAVVAQELVQLLGDDGSLQVPTSFFLLKPCILSLLRIKLHGYAYFVKENQWCCTSARDLN